MLERRNSLNSSDFNLFPKYLLHRPIDPRQQKRKHLLLLPSALLGLLVLSPSAPLATETVKRQRASPVCLPSLWNLSTMPGFPEKPSVLPRRAPGRGSRGPLGAAPSGLTLQTHHHLHMPPSRTRVLATPCTWRAERFCILKNLIY